MLVVSLQCGRRGCLMDSAMDSVPGGPGSSCVYKWVSANLLLGVTLRWTSIPSRGE